MVLHNTRNKNGQNENLLKIINIQEIVFYLSIHSVWRTLKTFRVMSVGEAYCNKNSFSTGGNAYESGIWKTISYKMVILDIFVSPLLGTFEKLLYVRIMTV